jgi:hypothetical protein
MFFAARVLFAVQMPMYGKRMRDGTLQIQGINGAVCDWAGMCCAAPGRTLAM